MTTAPRIAIIDSGITGDVAARTAFRLSQPCPPQADSVQHGSRLADIIRASCPTAALLDAQVFLGGWTTSANAVAAALDWAIAQKADMAVMSFGLTEDRPVLREAVEHARQAGLLLLASAPARGGPVYPAAYTGVVRITGDARCAPGEMSRLDTAQADLGACVHALDSAPGETSGTGSSFAVGHCAAALALRMARGLDLQNALADLLASVRFQGPERRT